MVSGHFDYSNKILLRDGGFEKNGKDWTSQIVILPFTHRGDLNGDDAQKPDKEGHQRVSFYYGTNEEAPCCGISILPS